MIYHTGSSVFTKTSKKSPHDIMLHHPLALTLVLLSLRRTCSFMLRFGITDDRHWNDLSPLIGESSQSYLSSKVATTSFSTAVA